MKLHFTKRNLNKFQKSIDKQDVFRYDIYVNFKKETQMSRFKLSEIAEITQGNILTRIKPGSQFDETIEFDSISMQELSYIVGQSDILEKSSKVKVLKEKESSCVLTKQKDIVVGLSSRKAFVIDETRSNNLLLSNFALIRILDINILDPHYFCWLLNEDLQFQKYIDQKMQGSANVIILSINNVKDMELELPDIEKQKMIGEIYELYMSNIIFYNIIYFMFNIYSFIKTN